MSDPLKLPTLAITELYHVGTLDITQKYAYSYEGGHGLSVSTEPDAWRQINRGLTKGKTHHLSRPGAHFIDVHALTDTQKDALFQWGVEQGYLTPAVIYYCEWFDDEQDDWMRLESYTQDDIVAEAEGYDVPVQQRDGYKGTASFVDFIGDGNRDAYELIVVVYAAQATTVDGVYWTDPLDVSRYQAPRGVILQDRLPCWHIKTLDEGEA